MLSCISWALRWGLPSVALSSESGGRWYPSLGLVSKVGPAPSTVSRISGAARVFRGISSAADSAPAFASGMRTTACRTARLPTMGFGARSRASAARSRIDAMSDWIGRFTHRMTPTMPRAPSPTGLAAPSRRSTAHPIIAPRYPPESATVAGSKYSRPRGLASAPTSVRNSRPEPHVRCVTSMERLPPITAIPTPASRTGIAHAPRPNSRPSVSESHPPSRPVVSLKRSESAVISARASNNTPTMSNRRCDTSGSLRCRLGVRVETFILSSPVPLDP